VGRSVITAGMLEDLRRSGVEIRLCKEALITPAARDWLRDHRLPVTWTDGDRGVAGNRCLAVVMDIALPEMRAVRAVLERSGALAEVIEPVGGRNGVLAATRELCERIACGAVAKGAVFTPDVAIPVCIANKHPGVRAALGTSVAAVEDACRELAANLLVIEQQRATTWQIRQMIDRLLNAPSLPRSEIAAVIEAVEKSRV